ncbi:LysR family transcriptional regulator, partial [Actinoplanes sp. NPDC048791]|uniref:helix-turn-helix domain-containing protein n=1 Tax=Actinoplanes sp. NPDC048791 TaxID=3154623 RepID=UPI0033C6C5B3
MGQIDLRRLRLLRELRDRGTVTAVGSALHMTSSAVSQQLALLAKDVGAPLLEPHPPPVRLQ